MSPEPGLKGKLCEVRHYDALTGLVLQKLAVFVFTEETVAFGALCSSLSHRHPLLSFLLQRKSGRGVCVCVHCITPVCIQQQVVNGRKPFIVC